MRAIHHVKGVIHKNRKRKEETVKQEWRIQGKTGDFKGIGKKYGIDQVIARIIRNRGVETEAQFEEYLKGDIPSLHSPHLMKDMDRAAQLVKQAIEEGLSIRIIGDYDIDGINSIYILYSGLKRLNANVDYVVPHRVTDGYGINERLIKEAKDAGRELLITCDNGIAAYSPVEYAKSLGMRVIITDHHDIPFEEADGGKRYLIPPADAVVDPKQKDCAYPWKKICGAVVAYKLIQALFELYERPKEEILGYLEYAAIATVGDVVDLQGENRIIVKCGLKKLRKGENPGLNALINVNKLDREHISAYHVGFVLGPCLNASGRLESAMQAVRLLLAQDRSEAETAAGDLLALNEERKELTRRGVGEALQMIENSGLKQDMVLVLYLPECHESIVGIIAGRIREKYNKPVIVFAPGENCLKGSGRSIEGYNMFEKLSECKELLTRFGGHPMAAGMSIPPENLEPLRRKLNENCGLTEKELTLRVWIDVPMPFEYITEELIGQLSLLEPFGKGNEKPVFAERGLTVKRLYHMGKENQYTRMVLGKDNGFTMEAVMFCIDGLAEEAYLKGKKINVLYYPSVNEYQGRRTIQAVINGVAECAAVHDT